MVKSAIKVAALGALAAAAPSTATGGLDLLQTVQKGAGSSTVPRGVSKQDIWLEDRSAGRLQNTRGHLTPPPAFDPWQGFYAAEVAAFSC